MLAAIGAKNIDELFSDIPGELRLDRKLNIPDGISEWETFQRCRKLASKNKMLTCFAGAGVYDHIIPAAARHITNYPGFYTSYTPYQAEMSQGILQAIFEFQTAISEISGLPASNASLYNGFTSAAEACAIACRLKKEADTILVSSSVHPYLLKLLNTYFQGEEIKIETTPLIDGRTDLNALKASIGPRVAGFLGQSPNFFGMIEDFDGFAETIHDNSGLFIISANPLSLAKLKSPGEWGADIAVGDAQPFGLAMNFGGPGLGYMAVTEKLMRQLPGRIVGQTKDSEGKTAYVLTLQAREQHIKRARATSNICTNQALAAITVSAYLSIVGRENLIKLAGDNMNAANYAFAGLTAKTPLKPAFQGPIFNEFSVKGPGIKELRDYLLTQGFLPGIRPRDISDSYDENLLLIAVTEKRTKTEIDDFIQNVRRFYIENNI